MYDLIVGLGESLIKHGVSLSFIGAAIFVVLKQRPSKRWLRKRLPWLLRGDGDIANYEARQIRIEQDVRAIKEHLGVRGWDADSKTGRIERSVTTGTHKKSSSPQAGYAHVIIARYFTRLKETYHLSQRRMNMKSKLLSRKFLAAVGTSVFIALNDALGWGFSTDTITAIITVVVGWIAVEGATDIVKKKPEVANDYTTAKDAGDI